MLVIERRGTIEIPTLALVIAPIYISRLLDLLLLCVSKIRFHVLRFISVMRCDTMDTPTTSGTGLECLP